MPKKVLPLLVVTLLASSACAAGGEGLARLNEMPGASSAPAPFSTTSEPTTEPSTPSEDPTADQSDTGPAEAPPGFRMVRAETTGLEFAAPRSWMVLDERRMREVMSEKDIDEAAAALGIAPEMFRTFLEQVDAFVIGPNGNLNVTELPFAGELPSPALLKSQFKMLNADVEDVYEIETSVGDGRVVTYKLGSPSLGEVYGASLFVRLSTGVANLVATMSTLDEAVEMIDEIAPTLDEAGAPGEA